MTAIRHVLTCASALVGFAFATAAEPTPHPAATYRTEGQPVTQRPDGFYLCEAEEFAVQTPGWSAQGWGANLYASTFANTFLSRKAFLGAPSTGPESLATINVDIATAGKQLVLVRYEAAYRFETQFRVRILQQDKVVFDRLYGARANPKIWAFGEKVKPEVGWYWGAVENVVWEGHDAWAELQKGPAQIQLIAVEQAGDVSPRNVDCVMLTADAEDVAERIEKEGYLPLDGLLTQAGDVWLKLHVHADSAPVVLTMKNGIEHSPYWVHKRNWRLPKVEAATGAVSDWVDVGGALDTLNDGKWLLTAKPGAEGDLHYSVEFGVRDAAGTIASIGRFESRQGTLLLAYEGDTRYSRQIRDIRTVLDDLLADLAATPVRGKRPTLTPIYGYTFDPIEGDDAYNAKVDQFVDMYAMRVRLDGSSDYIDLRNKTHAQIAEIVAKMGDRAAAMNVVSLGDEISLGKAKPGPKTDVAFRTWLQGLGLKAEDLRAGATWDDISYSTAKELEGTDPAVWYWSHRYSRQQGINGIKATTDVILELMPQVHIGANFSPHHGGASHAYLGETHQWIETFRQGGMTMPWSEDYIWQLPVGSQQMNFISLAQFRAGVRHRREYPIHFYVMAHWPGNTPDGWRRQFYGDLGGGMKIVNLFEFRPVHVAYTENYVSHYPMYEEVRRSFYELGLFEDIVQAGQVPDGNVGLWFSQTGDIWHNLDNSRAANKRGLYVALRHRQLAVDAIIDADALDGTLDGYAALYLTDSHVERRASQAIADWVAKGGTLVATAGAGMYDERNQPNTVLRALLGVDETAFSPVEGSAIGYLKQDLPFAKVHTTVKWGEFPAIPVVGPISQFTAGGGAEVSATFADGTAAVTRRAHGQGSATYIAFLPALSYFQPAIPRRPVDRGSTEASMAHFIPTAFDAGAGDLIGQPAAAVERPVICSDPLVDAGIIVAKSGTVVALSNWRGVAITGFSLRLAKPAHSGEVTLASGGNVTGAADGTDMVYTFDLDPAGDALIIR